MVKDNTTMGNVEI